MQGKTTTTRVKPIAEQSKARTEQDKTILAHDMTKQNKMRQGDAIQNNTRQGDPNQNTTTQYTTRQEQDKAIQA